MVADVISIYDFIANKWNVEKPLISADTADAASPPITHLKLVFHSHKEV